MKIDQNITHNDEIEALNISEKKFETLGALDLVDRLKPYHIDFWESRKCRLHNTVDSAKFPCKSDKHK